MGRRISAYQGSNDACDYGYARRSVVFGHGLVEGRTLQPAFRVSTGEQPGEGPEPPRLNPSVQKDPTSRRTPKGPPRLVTSNGRAGSPRVK